MALPALAETGFKVFSQADDDGILLYIFSVLGTTSKKCVEICAGDGIECNTANLIINHSWSGLLVDGNEKLVQRGQHFYRNHPQTFIYPPKFIHAWVTRNNVDRIITDNGFAGEIDLLSLDMDGMDYWILEAIEAARPRVLVVEYQDIVGAERAITVPYSDNFCAYQHSTTNGMPNYCGASLAAFNKLARRKGYRLVGCDNFAINAFFVRNDLGEQAIPEVAVQKCLAHPKAVWGATERFPLVKNLPWIEV